MKISEPDAGEILESIYKRYHSYEYVHPDPLEFLKNYPKPWDREIAGLIASSLAVGRVKSILKAVKSVLNKLPSPRETILSITKDDLKSIFKEFKYRFYSCGQLVDLLFGIKICLEKYGSLNNCFLSGMRLEHINVLPALNEFVKNITAENCEGNGILPLPARKSACKRLNLFLRWMVRQDRVDPGGWEGIHAKMLIVPVDTHMLRISRILGFTSRKQSDIKAATDITESLKLFDPEDPVRFDFSITRLGIHPDLSYEDLLKGVVI